jgi:rhamnogalacturonyl hydrolase YesR
MLNSPFAGLLSLGSRFGRIALTQFGRRCPVNFRPLLAVPKGVNPKALALFLEGNVKLYRTLQDEKYLENTQILVKKLAELRSPGVSGSAWGYNFPWQNRFQCLPRYTPTIVNSAFAGHALLDCYEATGNQTALDLAVSIPDFYLKDLNRKTEQDTFCFSYTPEDQNFVHNANMLGASLLARIGMKYDRRELLDPALSALAYSMKYQREDGSWFYAETTAQSWIDSFHTGFNLEALRHFLKLDLVPEYQGAYEQGRA